ncbi:hypothetical protein RhiirA5_386102 [Rhizophagus irregularis]|uniref:Uncharacterized protein n=1 Tax=Rhizophagus irregularis TaxID=588596 RepID=A0A2N0NL64_9GLOM|nr:hypothetical protein RhiirA5_386102 [Rhizophagus irregularis]
MPSRRKKTLQNNNTKNKRGNGSTIETDNTTTSTSCEKTPVISNKTPSREKTPVISTKTPSREKTPAAILTNPATPVTISPIPSSPEKTVITVNIENDDFKDSLSESSEVEEQSQHQKKTGFNNQKEYVSDDFVREIFNTYMVYTPAMKDDIDALDTLKSFLCRALSFHIGEKLNGNHNHEETLHKIKGLDHITKDLVLKSRLYADVINDI